MSANFLNLSAIMAGVDLHKFVAAVPPPMMEVPVEGFPYLVGVPFDWIAIPWNQTRTVRADAQKMVDVDYALFLVPHIAVALPGPSQAKNLSDIVLTSGSEVSLGIGSVSGEGDPLAACIHGSVGWNLNCWEEGDHPSGSVFCVCSVQTTPSWIDYALAAFKWLVVGFLAEYLGKLGGDRLGKICSRLSEAVWKFLVKQAVINAMEQVAALARYIARRLGY